MLTFLIFIALGGENKLHDLELASIVDVVD